MYLIHKLLPTISALIILVVFGAHGQTVDEALDELIEEELKGELGEDILSDGELAEILGEDFMAELSTKPGWDVDLKVRTGLGHGDNVLYGAFEQVGSGYLFGALDGLIYRLPEPGQANAYIYFYGEHLSYFEDVDDGRLYITQGQVTQGWKENRNIGLMGTHIFYDQVFDASADLDTLDTFGVSAHQFEVSPHVEVYFNDGSVFKLEAVFGGTRYEDSYEDSNNSGGRLTFRREFSEVSSLEAIYTNDHRNYREKSPRDADGYAMDGLLQFRIQQGALNWRRNASSPTGWNFLSSAKYLLQEDNGSGYYDYRRFRISQSAARLTEDWETKLVAAYSRYDYVVRPAETGGTEFLYREGMELTLNLKRTLNDRAKLFFDGQFEHNHSNSLENVYDATRVVLGIEWAL